MNEVKRRRRLKRRGTSIAIQNIVQKLKSDCYEVRKVTSRVRGSWVSWVDKEYYNKLVYRTYRPQSYINCTFLNDHDRVMAISKDGPISVVKLPDFQDNCCRPLGTCLVNDLYFPELDTYDGVKVKSLNGGKGFVLGNRFGKCCIVDLERECLLDTRNLSRTNFEHTSTLPIQAWGFNGPRRRYHRNSENKDLSLVNLIGQHLFCDQQLRQIPVWDTRDDEHFEEYRHIHENENHAEEIWDFFETPSALLTAKINNERDSFWLYILDNRTKDGQKDPSKPTIAIDTTLDSNRGRLEHVSSCTFVSEHCLATSSIICLEKSNFKIWEQTEKSNLIKLWDLRMLRNQKPLSTISYHPSFPEDKVVGLEPISPSFPDVELEPNSPRFPSPAGRGCNYSSITSLHVAHPNSSNGTILVKAVENDEVERVGIHATYSVFHPKVRFDLVDLGSGRVLHRVGQSKQHPYCVSASNEVLVCLGGSFIGGFMNRENDKLDQSLCIYNLLKPRSEGRRQTSKRHASGDIKPAKDPTCTEIKLDLRDSDGVDTKLSCLAINDSGTSILGTSYSGDFHLWRGS